MNFEIKGFKDLEKTIEKQTGQLIKNAESEANRAAARESTPEAKARAFALALRRHGITGVNEAEIRNQFKS